MTTPAQPESKTPRTDVAVLRDEPDSRDQYVNADFARQLETELNAAHIQAEADRREIERRAKIIETLTKQIATAQQRIKELESDGRIVDWVEEELNAAVEGEDGTRWTEWLVTAPFPFRGTFRDACLAAMSREPKEGEAK